jgi:hypothetical protein
VAYAWMPEAKRIRADIDGGPLRGGAPRAVWLTLGTVSGAVSVQSAASRLISERRPCHLVWDPLTGEIGQLISVLRAGRALGAADRVEWAPERVRTHVASANADGRVCVQIGVLSHSAEPFTAGPMSGIDAIMNWLDSWYVARRGRSEAQWAQGGHFAAAQVPGCEHAGPSTIDVDRLTGPHGLQVRARDLPVSLPEAHALAIPA